MTRGSSRRSRLTATAGAVITLSALAIASPVAADCGDNAPVLPRVANARGTTFIGTYEGYGPASDPVRVRWAVDRVLAGDITEGTLRFDTFECGLTLLLPGVRYLFSTGADLAHGEASWSDSVAWEVGADGALALAMFVDQQDPPQAAQDRVDYPASVRAVTTLAQARALLAADLPPTDTTDRFGDGPGWAVLVAGLLGAAAFHRRRRLRARQDLP